MVVYTLLIVPATLLLESPLSRLVCVATGYAGASEEKKMPSVETDIEDTASSDLMVGKTSISVGVVLSDCVVEDNFTSVDVGSSPMEYDVSVPLDRGMKSSEIGAVCLPEGRSSEIVAVIRTGKLSVVDATVYSVDARVAGSEVEIDREIVVDEVAGDIAELIVELAVKDTAPPCFELEVVADVL